MIKTLLLEFLSLLETSQIEIYNEFSLQHELGIFLRSRLPSYKVQFERNTKYFGIIGLVKHEIDIVVYNDSERYAIELKYPVNGQYPEQMYAFIKDICFMEGLRTNGFHAAYCLMLVTDKNFYLGRKRDGIYSYFRSCKPLCGTVIKPTGSRDEFVTLEREHRIFWHSAGNKYKFCLISI